MSTISSKRSGLRYSHDVFTRGQPMVALPSCAWMLKPSERKNACSAFSIMRKKFAKWTMPAMSVSANSTRWERVNSCGISR